MAAHNVRHRLVENKRNVRPVFGTYLKSLSGAPLAWADLLAANEAWHREHEPVPEFVPSPPRLRSTYRLTHQANWSSWCNNYQHGKCHGMRNVPGGHRAPCECPHHAPVTDKGRAALRDER